jgi:hypothetical protein
MKLKTIQTQVVELDEKEIKLLITLLNYCYHRAECHQSPVSQFKDRIKQFRKDLQII